MSKELTENDVRHVAKLARLNCSEAEIQAFTGQLSAILAYVEQLNEVDTEGIEPLAHCLAVHTVLREDIPGHSLSNGQALANAPQRDGEFFAVPKVLGDGGA